VAVYDHIADWYNAGLQNNAFYHELLLPCFFNLLPPLEGQLVCDLACGQGIVAREFARQGATVVGVDIAAKLLALARDEEMAHPLGIVYQQDDAQKLVTLANATFDGVVCNLALMDIADHAAVFRAVWRILCSRGWFVFSLTHPCFQTPHAHWLEDEHGGIERALRGYFREGFWRSHNPDGVRGQVGAHHRMLSTYMNDLCASGFVLERMLEPPASEPIAERIPGYREVPLFMLMLWRKV
jgi:ubiquinone/menaquinone biosynthesis C-methylase UbiE